MRRWAARLLPIALGLALSGCRALMPPLVSPAAGGPAWTEVTSEHFVVWTDLEREDGTGALSEFEAMYAVLEDVGFPSRGGQTGRMNVVLFAREKDYFQFAPVTTTALFVPALPNDLDEVPTMVMFGELDDHTRLTFQHELTHLFIRQSLGWAPPWLHEGLAEYYSTLRVDDGFAYLGEPLPHRGASAGMDWRETRVGAWSRQLIPLHDLPTVRRLVTADTTTFYAWAQGGGALPGARQRQAAYYCGAWGLVHLLLNGPPQYRERFSRYIDALAHGKRNVKAWRSAFGDIPRKKLEESYRIHLRLMERGTTVHRIRYEPAPLPPPQQRPMSAAEVHVLWARLRPWVPLNADVVRADLAAALRDAPGSPEVRFWQGRFLAAEGRPREAERELRAAAEAGDARYLFGLAKLYATWVDPATRTPYYPDRLASAVAELTGVARSANALDFIASFHADRGEAAEGVALAGRAIRADPTCFRCMDTYARLLFQQGRVSDAVAMQERALSLVPERGAEHEMLEHLRRYRRALSGAPGGGAASEPGPLEPPRQPDGGQGGGK